MGNNKIINRVYIGDINVSNLSQEEAKKKIETWYKETGLSNIELTYNELSENIIIEQFDASINIDELIKKACQIGKSGNIIKDNYDILFSRIFKKNIELNINIKILMQNRKMCAETQPFHELRCKITTFS